MTADQPRDWDRELAAIDKVIAKQQGSGTAGQGGSSVPAPTPLPPGPERVPAAPPVPRKRSAAVAWFWTILALALAVALPLWPYPKECGLQLFFFLGATGLTVIAGVIGALETWANRRGFAHLLCLLVLLWAGVVGASEALPRSGYAKESRPWLCPATPAPAPAPAPAPTQQSPQPAPQSP
jgi:hypothetical protein